MRPQVEQATLRVHTCVCVLGCMCVRVCVCMPAAQQRAKLACPQRTRLPHNCRRVPPACIRPPAPIPCRPPCTPPQRWWQRQQRHTRHSKAHKACWPAPPQPPPPQAHSQRSSCSCSRRPQWAVGTATRAPLTPSRMTAASHARASTRAHLWTAQACRCACVGRAGSQVVCLRRVHGAQVCGLAGSWAVPPGLATMVARHNWGA